MNLVRIYTPAPTQTDLAIRNFFQNLAVTNKNSPKNLNSWILGLRYKEVRLYWLRPCDDLNWIAKRNGEAVTTGITKLNTKHYSSTHTLVASTQLRSGEVLSYSPRLLESQRSLFISALFPVSHLFFVLFIYYDTSYPANVAIILPFVFHFHFHFFHLCLKGLWYQFKINILY